MDLDQEIQLLEAQLRQHQNNAIACDGGLQVLRKLKAQQEEEKEEVAEDASTDE